MNLKNVLTTVLMIALVFVTTACKERANTDVKLSPGETVIWSSHEKRPVWTQVLSAEEGAFVYVTGLSDRFTTELDAREHAMFRARKEIGDYILGMINIDNDETRDRVGTAGEGSNVQVKAKNQARTTAKVAISQVRPKEWYLRKIRTESSKIMYEAIVLAEVPREVVQREVTRVTRALMAYEKQDSTYPLKQDIHTPEPIAASGF